jgi:ParB-like chromosome segregation protein Spo0J
MTGGALASMEVAPSELSTSLCGLRLSVAEAQVQMQRSLARRGQLTPLQAWRAETGELELFDGLKRWRAAQSLSWSTVRVEVHAFDAGAAKVGLLLCNEAAGLSDLEVAWVIRSLYREDHLDQPHIAQLLGRDKSWVCRKLTLAEDLSDELTAQVRLGLVSVTAAVELARWQRCNQDAAAQAVARRGLTTRQTRRLVEALLAAPQEQWVKVLAEVPPAAKASGPKGGAPRRTPGEQLVADAWVMKRVATRMQAQLLGRSLLSLGAPACAVVSQELVELRATLSALTTTLDARLGTSGATNAA